LVYLLWSMLLSFFPKRYRDRLPASAQADLRQGAMVSGFGLAATCFLTFVIRYLSFFQYRIGDIGQRTINRGAEGALGNPYAQFGMGAATTVEYLFQPLTLVLIYFGLEGTLRGFAALITQEITGTLPLYLLAWIEERFSQAHAERALGPRVPDIFEEIYSNEYDARIFTCRRRPRWDRMMTISVNDVFYEVLGEQPGKVPHHFIYRLRKSPKGRTVRAIHYFDPEELMKQKPARWGFLSWLGGVAQDKLAEIRAESHPILPDIIDIIYGKDYQLQIASQRAKEGWDHLVTIEYKGMRFEVLQQVGGTPTYPYVYLLRELPPGKIIRTIQQYDPSKPSDSTST
jgi:hypothetical protein